jgi:hypothetical protein
MAQVVLSETVAYGYLRPISTPGSSPQHLTYSSLTSQSPPVRDTFVIHLLDATICRQVIEWADSGERTQQRHYALPTNDVPVQESVSWDVSCL